MILFLVWWFADVPEIRSARRPDDQSLSIEVRANMPITP
jgi:hypothetical protein